MTGCHCAMSWQLKLQYLCSYFTDRYQKAVRPVACRQVVRSRRMRIRTQEWTFCTLLLFIVDEISPGSNRSRSRSQTTGHSGSRQGHGGVKPVSVAVSSDRLQQRVNTKAIIVNLLCGARACPGQAAIWLRMTSWAECDVTLWRHELTLTAG